MKAFWWLRRFADNFWYYYVERRQLGYGYLPLEVAIAIAYRHTTGFKDQLALCQSPAWGGENKDFYD